MTVGQAKLDLTNCDREPVHIPGSIQAHGILFVLKEPELIVLQVSENVQTVFGVPAQEILERPISCILDTDADADAERESAQMEVGVEILNKALLAEDIQMVNPITLCIKAGGREQQMDGIVHRVDGLLILELEKAEGRESSSFIKRYRQIETALTRLQLSSDLNQLCQVAAEEIRKITGFDRVMIYRFDEQWNGVVVAEDKKAELQAFLGLQFPASDIPAPARELYLKNWLRLISDAEEQGAAIIPVMNPLTQRPIDLSHAVLRGVSPMHIEYLKNMGVQASLSISLLKENKLWGLIVGHHLGAKLIGHETRIMCKLLGQVVSTQLLAKQSFEEYQYGMEVKNRQSELARMIMKDEDVLKELKGHGEDLLRLVNAWGLIICIEEEHETVGKVPEEAERQALIAWLKENMHEDVLATNKLSGVYQEAVKFKECGSGMLAISISRMQGAFLIWLRPEVIQTVNWGGNPEEGIKVGKSVSDLHPRKSFELWKQTISLTSLPWQPCEIQAATELRNSIVDKALQDMVLKQTLGLWLQK